MHKRRLYLRLGLGTHGSGTRSDPRSRLVNYWGHPAEETSATPGLWADRQPRPWCRCDCSRTLHPRFVGGIGRRGRFSTSGGGLSRIGAQSRSSAPIPHSRPRLSGSQQNSLGLTRYRHRDTHTWRLSSNRRYFSCPALTDSEGRPFWGGGRGRSPENHSLTHGLFDLGITAWGRESLLRATPGMIQPRRTGRLGFAMIASEGAHSSSQDAKTQTNMAGRVFEASLPSGLWDPQ